MTNTESKNAVPPLPGNYQILLSEMERMMEDNGLDVSAALDMMGRVEIAAEIASDFEIEADSVVDFVLYMLDSTRALDDESFEF